MHTNVASPDPGSVSRVNRRGLVLLVLVGVVLLASALVSPERTLERFHGVLFSPYFPVVLVVLWTVRVFLGWPMSLVAALVGYRYGVVLGLLVAYPGSVYTTLPPYLLAARAAGGDGDGWLRRLAAGGERYFATAGSVRGIVAGRLAPTPGDSVSGAAGLSGVPLPAFVLGTAIGEIPWIVAAVVAGASLDEFAAGAVPSDPLFLAVGALAAAVLLVGPAYRALA